MATLLPIVGVMMAAPKKFNFVDDAQREFVDLLERAYLHVLSTSGLEWISIETHSGWGKFA